MIERTNGCITHLVFKNEEIYKYCSKVQMEQLDSICCAIEAGRKAEGKNFNTYYICNTDEPYAEEVHAIILTGECHKKRN